jgi:hypothetical protein
MEEWYSTSVEKLDELIPHLFFWWLAIEIVVKWPLRILLFMEKKKREK